MARALAGRILRAARNPGPALAYVRATAKGWGYKIVLPLIGRRFTAGRRFRVFGSLSVRGPGQVIIGDDVVIWQTVTPWTHSPEAVLTIGNSTALSGTRFGCAQRITIGERGIIAECRIMDTDFHAMSANRHDPDEPVRTLPVEIADNVWIAVNAVLLPGARVGENSVVAASAVCSGNYAANTVIVGNPARAVAPIPESASPARRAAASSDGA